jgi:hypothetical protein
MTIDPGSSGSSSSRKRVWRAKRVDGFGDNRLVIGDCGCVYVYVLSTRSEGRSENRSTRFLNWV